MTEEWGQFESGGVGAPRWQGLAVGILAVIAIVALGIGWSASRTAHSAQQAFNTLKQDQQILSQRLAKAEETSAQVRGELNVVTDRLKLTQGELGRARKQAKQFKQQYDSQLAEMENSVKTELATKASAEDVKALGGNVSNVKSDLESTKQNIQMAKGELGTLIARNHEEIEQLRRLGQRDYYEFTIERKGERQQVATLIIELRATNPKKHQFTVALYLDDMRLVKRDRQINEPVYFYTLGGRAPLELVVNQVGKNKIVGYLSIPKANVPQQAVGG
jgi:predicted  nucleic acid-binding Zn-ribbon protein